MKITLPAQLLKVSSRADRSYVLTFNTRELSGESASMLLDELMSEGYLLYSPNNDLTDADIPDERADSMTGQKTQAQRLRGVLYRLWEQNKPETQGGLTQSFESFYQNRMELIIDQVKSRLE